MELSLLNSPNIPTIPRTLGMGVFLSSTTTNTPIVFESFIHRIHAIPNTVVFLVVRVLPIAKISRRRRLAVTSCGEEIYLVIARFGFAYKRSISLPKIIRLAQQRGMLPDTVSIAETTYFMSRVTVRASRKAPWWKRIPIYAYALMKNFFPNDISKSIRVPTSQLIEVGIHVSLK